MKVKNYLKILLILCVLLGNIQAVFAVNIETPTNIAISETSIDTNELKPALLFGQTFNSCGSDSIFLGYESTGSHVIKCKPIAKIKEELDLGFYPADCIDGQTAFGITNDNRFLNCANVRVAPCGLRDSDLAELNNLRLIPSYYGPYNYKTIDSPSLKYANTNTVRTAEDWCNTTELYLANKNMSVLPNAVAKLRKLTILDIQNNQITQLPEKIGNLTQLKTISLINNRLTSLPESFSNLKLLSGSLDLSNNRLTSLPSQIGNLQNITSLNLSKNNTQTYYYYNDVWYYDICPAYGTLKTLPESIGNLTNLTSLNMECSGLESLPESFGNLTNVNDLKLRSNNLASLPNSFGNLSSLSGSLVITNNKLASLPESFGQLTNLTSINLNKNKLSTIPTSFSKLKKIANLNLSQNLITSLPS